MLNAALIMNAYEKLAQESHEASYFLIEVEVVEETGSTNADLLQRAQDINKPLALIARHQTAGRGRAGRVWHSVADDVLTFSLAWRTEKTAQELMGVSLVIGVALAEKLLEIGVPVNLKWPNDILKEGKKLAGILIESQKKYDGSTCLVMGVGLNLRASDAFEKIIGQTVADSAWLAQMDRNELMAHLLYALAQAMNHFEQAGFSYFQHRWNQLNAHAHQMVNIIDNGQIVHHGTIVGIDTQGRLLLQTKTGQVSIHTGDVSLRTAIV